MKTSERYVANFRLNKYLWLFLSADAMIWHSVKILCDTNLQLLTDVPYEEGNFL